MDADACFWYLKLPRLAADMQISNHCRDADQGFSCSDAPVAAVAQAAPSKQQALTV